MQTWDWNSEDWEEKMEVKKKKKKIKSKSITVSTQVSQTLLPPLWLHPKSAIGQSNW